MAYTLEAFIAHHGLFDHANSSEMKFVALPLPQEFALLPLTDKLRHSFHSTPTHHTSFYNLTSPLAEWANELWVEEPTD